MSALVQGMPVVIEEKHPWSVKRIVNDWTDFADGGSIAASAWVIAKEAGDMECSIGTTDGLKTMALISAGTVGITGCIENRVEFVDGRKEVMTIILKISTKVPT
jgi:hypothetical protein